MFMSATTTGSSRVETRLQIDCPAHYCSDRDSHIHIDMQCRLTVCFQNIVSDAMRVSVAQFSLSPRFRSTAEPFAGRKRQQLLNERTHKD